MRIAQIAPLTEAIPPKLYGGTERVISWLTDELVALGHDVVLFASGDSRTSAKLQACWPKALRLDGSVRDPNALHMAMLEQVRRQAQDFDLMHFHLDYYPFSLFSRQATPFVHPSWSSRPAGTSGGLRDISLHPCDLDLRRPAAAGARRRMDPYHPSRPARAPFDATAGQAGLLCFPRTHFAGKGD